MSVYVDDMRTPFGRMIMCHMVADSEPELHVMADRIGVARRWYQGDHYDIALSRRALAIEAGALEVSLLDVGRWLLRRRRGLVVRFCPECRRPALIRFEWAQTALPPGLSYWRCALEPDACGAGPFVLPTPPPATEMICQLCGWELTASSGEYWLHDQWVHADDDRMAFDHLPALPDDWARGAWLWADRLGLMRQRQHVDGAA